MLSGDGEQAQRRPDVPRAEATGVVVARQPAPARPELVRQRGLDHLGGPVGPPGVVVGPGDLHVRLVVEALEPVQRVAGVDLVGVRRVAELGDGRGVVPEEPVQQLDERVVATGQRDATGHVVQQSERVVPPATLVECRVDEQPGVRVVRVDPPPGELLELLGELVVPEPAGDPGRARVALGEVERVGHRVGDPAIGELLAVRTAEVGMEVDEGPVPVDRARRARGAAVEPERGDVGDERVRERARLPEEPVAATRHPVADGEVALLLADRQQRDHQLHGPVRGDRRQQWELGLVDVPHRRDVEHPRPVTGPERGLVAGEARLEEAVVERRREDGPLRRVAALDRHTAEVVVPGGLRGRTPAREHVTTTTDVRTEVAFRLLGAAQREPESHLDDVAGGRRAEHEQPEWSQRRLTDRVELELATTDHEPAVVPQQLSPSVGGVELGVDGDLDPLEGHLAAGGQRPDPFERRPPGHGRAVVDCQPAVREVEHDPRVLVAREGVAVHRGLRPDGQLAGDARVQRRPVRPGTRVLVVERPGRPELVQRQQHGGDAEVVVVLADRAGPRLLEVGEPGRLDPVQQPPGLSVGVQVVEAVPGRVRAGVRAGRDHPQRVAGTGVGVADLCLRPPPAGGQPVGRWQVRRSRADERVDGLTHLSATLRAGHRDRPARVTSRVLPPVGWTRCCAAAGLLDRR